MDDAEKNNLLGKYNWKTNPKKMLIWRAISMGVSVVFPEVSFAFAIAAPQDDSDPLAEEAA